MKFLNFVWVIIGGRMINFYVPIFSKKIVDALAEKIFAWDLILALVGLKILQGLYFTLFSLV